MGCGSSVTENKIRPEIPTHHKYPSKPKRPREPFKIGIEEARKRRAEEAKKRTRRASVMGLLEAEKLKERKRSISSIYNISVNDELLEEKVVMSEAGQEIPFHDTRSETSVDNERRKNIIETSNDNNHISKKHIEIIISPGTRPNSRDTINTNGNENSN